ncbi:MAG: RnfABCDGE type electron transport complex subunit G [Nitrospirota bacterium]|nr:RnfABCDGE type electron transport complex subunit G [Nitrospirota bacterium]
MNRMTVVLMAVCVIGAVVLAVTDRLTSGPIADQKRRELVRSLGAVLPPHTNSADQDTRQVTGDDGRSYTLYLARMQGEWVGTAVPVTAPDGYSGNIDILVGVDRAGEITGVAVLAHAETPGLGDRVVTDPTWLPRLRGRTLDNTHWAVRKDGGDIDQFTGATITPRAVTNAVHRALEVCARFCR